MEQVDTIMEWLAVVIELTGSLIMVWAFVVAVVSVVIGSFRAADDRSRIRNLQVARCGLGVKLVFALELMIISDLLQTMASRSLDDMILLGGLVGIRTVIAYFLNKEIQDISAELAQSKGSS